jgi:TolB-like protein/DNA-binding winged helix-turn-helix (wHTH) protein/predicted Zn-dependent protease
MKEEKPHTNNVLYRFGPFCLDVEERRLTRGGENIPLPRKTFDLLLVLVAEAGHLMTREALIDILWPDTVVEEQGLTTRLYALRKALEDDGNAPAYIETERGVGYRFIAAVGISEKNRAFAEESDGTSGEGEHTSHRRHTRQYLNVIGMAAFIIAIAVVLLWWESSSPETQATSSPTIVVLPFDNLSANQDDAYIAAGVRDTILTRLAQLNSIQVVSRSASDNFSSHPKDLTHLANALNVNTVLEGSVQIFDQRVMINVQLVNARTHDHIWAGTFTRNLNGLFNTESSIAAKVATALQRKLHPRELARLSTPPTNNSKAYLLYLKADYYAHRAFDFASTKSPEQAVSKANGYYRQALDLDPKFALAWAKLALLDIRAYWFQVDYTPQRRKAAEKAAARAVKLDPHLPEAHIARGYTLYYGAGDYSAALQQFKTARENLPYDANVVGAMAYIHRRQGHWKKTLDELQQAHELDPLNPLWLYESGVTLRALRRYDAAIRQFSEALAIAPDDYAAQLHKIHALVLAGRMHKARQAMAHIPPKADPLGFVTSMRIELAMFARQPEKALKILKNAGNWLPYQPIRADALALMGDKRDARAAYKKRCRALKKKLRKHPDSPDIASALGLAEAGLGNRKEALKAGHHATELFPLDKDAVAGPRYLAILAKIQARLGDAPAANKLLAKLLAIAAGSEISVPLLRNDPVWDPIRHSSGFQALLRKYDKSAAPETLSTGATRQQ